ncbi:MAG: hypothetical protein R3C12_23470 [Planctomycetaceae bacterium]
MPAIIQSSRFESEENTWRLTQPIDEPFEGVVRAGRDVASQQAVRGRISSMPSRDPADNRLKVIWSARSSKPANRST